MAILYALLSAFGYGSVNAFIGVSSKRLGIIGGLFGRSLVVSLLIIPFWLTIGKTPDFKWGLVAFTLGLSLLGYVGLVFLYKAFSTGKPGVVAPVIQPI